MLTFVMTRPQPEIYEMLPLLTFDNTDISSTMYIETYSGRKSTVIKTLRVFDDTKQLYITRQRTRTRYNNSMITGDTFGSWRRRHILLLSCIVDWYGYLGSLFLGSYDFNSCCSEFDLLLGPCIGRNAICNIRIRIRLSQDTLKQSRSHYDYRNPWRYSFISHYYNI